MNFLGFVIGPTNVGKSTLLQVVKSVYGEKVGLVEVGKILRAKYSPDYFDGDAAPEKTAKEARELMKEGLEVNKNRDIVLVDGQPREVTQCDKIIDEYLLPLNYSRVIHLYAPPKVRLDRANKRDTGEALELSLQRMVNDIPPLYEVLSMITHRAKHKLITINTSTFEYRAEICFDILYNATLNGVN